MVIISNRAFYSSDILTFIDQDTNSILGLMVKNNPYDLNDLQKNAWIEEISILKKQLQCFSDGYILLEYIIPRMGKRIDAVVLYNGIVFLLEFKVGDSEYRKTAFDQVMDYALDLKNFQKESKDRIIVPIVISTEAQKRKNELLLYGDRIFSPLGTNKHEIRNLFYAIAEKHQNEPNLIYGEWENSAYQPTPTIIEAARALYSNHNVLDITRSDSGAKNLTLTTTTIEQIINESKFNSRKSIIFVTGVPGAGKTLVGLNLASFFHNYEAGEHAVFLSGNQPLVSVLKEALARDKVIQSKESGSPKSKSTAMRELSSFIQIIHHYRDDYVGNDRIPTERIAIFDESQRAWTRDEISSFMARKKGIRNFDYSEPEFLIGTMDRFSDWAVIICLIGGGQEINKGEAGMPEWFNSLKKSFRNWDVYTSIHLDDAEYLRNNSWEELTFGLDVTVSENLHLANSLRSFRSESVAEFVKSVLDNDLDKAKDLYKLITQKYPIVISRSLEKAKTWVRNISRGNERYGLLASSNAARLKPYGVYYAKERTSISPENWFLNGKDDIRSSYFMEVVASEFETQGLELDFAVVAWDADFRYSNNNWNYYSMSNRLTPPNWSKIKSENNIIYLKNAYRVLLTRARQGFVIYIPQGTVQDKTRLPGYYDGTYNFLKSIGICEISDDELLSLKPKEQSAASN